MAEEPNRESQITDSLLTERQTLGESVPVDEVAVVEEPAKAKVRIRSIDIYRGLTMVGMIAVDNMGPSNNPPAWLDHPPWHGLTAADFIFPAFLFIMGMAVPLAISAKRPVRAKNVIRIAGLFLIGFILNLIGKKFNFDIGTFLMI
jgi:predicted acyltransferase